MNQPIQCSHCGKSMMSDSEVCDCRKTQFQEAEPKPTLKQKVDDDSDPSESTEQNRSTNQEELSIASNPRTESSVEQKSLFHWIDLRIIVIAWVLLMLSTICWLAYRSTPHPPPVKVPVWVKHYEDAEKLNGDFRDNDTFSKWDRQAKLVLNDALEYGGKMPPPEPMSAADAAFENALWFVPMQDRGYTMKYTEALGNLAIHYRNWEKWDDAELFHRKILELEQAEWRAKPHAAKRPDPSILIGILNKNGKEKEAEALQVQLVNDLESAAAKDPDPALKKAALRSRAEQFEMQGKISDAERCWIQMLDTYKTSWTDAQLAETKRENAKFEWCLGPAGAEVLQSAAEFYNRNNNAAGEERILVKALSLHKAILPDNHEKLKSDFDNLAKFYERQNEYDKAAKIIIERMKCVEDADVWQRLANAYEMQGKYEDASNCIVKSIALEYKEKSWDTSIAALYRWNAEVLQKAGKQEESVRSMEKAKSIDPQARGYRRNSWQ